MVRFRAGLGLGLTVDIQIGTIMTINEEGWARVWVRVNC